MNISLTNTSSHEYCIQVVTNHLYPTCNQLATNLQRTMNIATLCMYWHIGKHQIQQKCMGVFPQLRSLKSNHTILLRLCSKSSLDIFMQKVKLLTSFVQKDRCLTIAFTSQNGCFNHKAITLEEKVVVRD